MLCQVADQLEAFLREHLQWQGTLNEATQKAALHRSRATAREEELRSLTLDVQKCYSRRRQQLGQVCRDMAATVNCSRKELHDEMCAIERTRERTVQKGKLMQ